MIAAILAGGQSKRMGFDKACALVDAKRMIEHVINAVSDANLDYIVVAKDNKNLNIPADKFYCDLLEGQEVVNGLYTAFESTSEDKLILLGCDMPFISSKLLTYLANIDIEDFDAIIPFVNQREQGLLALYHKRSIEANRLLIEAGQLHFDRFRKNLNRKILLEHQLLAIDPKLKSFININEPHTLANYR